MSGRPVDLRPREIDAVGDAREKRLDARGIDERQIAGEHGEVRVARKRGVGERERRARSRRRLRDDEPREAQVAEHAGDRGRRDDQRFELAEGEDEPAHERLAVERLRELVEAHPHRPSAGEHDRAHARRRQAHAAPDRAVSSFSGTMGRSRTRTPVACQTAFAMRRRRR